MSSTGFLYIEVIPKQRTCSNNTKGMILCQEQENKEDLIEIAKTFYGEDSDIRIEGCRKMYSVEFDPQIYRLEKENNWKNYPFAVLWLRVVEGEKRCEAKLIKRRVCSLVTGRFFKRIKTQYYWEEIPVSSKKIGKVHIVSLG